MTGEDLAGAALALVGAPFRLHGRDPSIGLDCVGVLAVALGQTARIPNGYRMQGGQVEAVAAVARSLGLVSVGGHPEMGDALLLRPGPCQLHLAISTGAGMIVHAHAGLRRVVHGPLPCGWPVLDHWRLHS